MILLFKGNLIVRYEYGFYLIFLIYFPRVNMTIIILLLTLIPTKQNEV